MALEAQAPSVLQPAHPVVGAQQEVEGHVAPHQVERVAWGQEIEQTKEEQQHGKEHILLNASGLNFA